MKHTFTVVLSLLLLLLLPSLAMAQSQIVRRPTTKPKTVQKKTTPKAGKSAPKKAAPKSTGMSETERRSVLNNLVSNMVYVQGGTFTMGATSEQGDDAEDDEKPAHKVTVSSFSIGKYEVTQREWKAVMGSNPSDFKGDNRPVECVSWDDCQEFIGKLNSLTGKNFRLPTEAEWEYAARGGNKSQGHKYAGSNNLDKVGWYTDNSSSTTHEVGTKSPNELGLYDMSGNVWEWCLDWYGGYSSNSLIDPMGPARALTACFAAAAGATTPGAAVFRTAATSRRATAATTSAFASPFSSIFLNLKTSRQTEAKRESLVAGGRNKKGRCRLKIHAWRERILEVFARNNLRQSVAGVTAWDVDRAVWRGASKGSVLSQNYSE